MIRIAAIGLLLLSACAPFAARKIVEAQTPGTVTGAGATLVGPGNSASPTTQSAERTIAFTVPQVGTTPQLTPVAVQTPTPVPSAVPLVSISPAWIQERVTTQLGQHQDAAGIIKVAASVSQWGTVKWMGLICILVCIGGLLWSHGNPDGYPVVFWKVGGCGIALMLIGDHPAWLLILIIPFAFYAVQKLGLIRIP